MVTEEAEKWEEQHGHKRVTGRLSSHYQAIYHVTIFYVFASEGEYGNATIHDQSASTGHRQGDAAGCGRLL